jgi:hypothetical protein
MKNSFVFMWINLQNFLIFDSECVDHNVCNPVACIGHKGCKNIVIDPVYWDHHNELLDLIEFNTDQKVTRDWVVKCSDGFTIDTWDGLLLKKYELTEKE